MSGVGDVDRGKNHKPRHKPHLLFPNHGFLEAAPICVTSLLGSTIKKKKNSQRTSVFTLGLRVNTYRIVCHQKKKKILLSLNI